MAGCEIITECKLLQNKEPEMKAVTDKVKREHCLRNNSACMRYKIYQAKMQSGPITDEEFKKHFESEMKALLPHEQERAQKIIARLIRGA